MKLVIFYFFELVEVLLEELEINFGNFIIICCCLCLEWICKFWDWCGRELVKVV